MKKILIIFILCLTGCVKNEDFNKICTYKNNSESIKEEYSINVTYDNLDNVKEAIVMRTFTSLNDYGKDVLKNIKDSSVSFDTKYALNDNIKITVSKNEDDVYQIKYYLKVSKLDENILDEFMIKKNSIKFFNKMRDENINCE